MSTGASTAVAVTFLSQVTVGVFLLLVTSILGLTIPYLLRLIVDDGRNFLERDGPAYDVIVSEPSNPWMTGAASLFTREFWQIARARLAEGGVFCLYGPFNVGGHFTSPSNEVFDRHLRERDRTMGVRDLEALTALAVEFRMRLSERQQLPANNQLLVFRENRAG